MVHITETEMLQSATTTLPSKWEILVKCDNLSEKDWVMKQLNRGVKRNKTSQSIEQKGKKA